jgi:hypothetical protein
MRFRSSLAMKVREMKLPRDFLSRISKRELSLLDVSDCSPLDESACLSLGCLIV